MRYIEEAINYSRLKSVRKCSEFGECFYAASKIREEDIETWVTAWDLFALHPIAK